MSTTGPDRLRELYDRLHATQAELRAVSDPDDEHGRELETRADGLQLEITDVEIGLLG
jgi:hypothetical protein